MQNEKKRSSTHVSESELIGLGQNGVETTERITSDETYCDIKVYRQLRPLLTLMKIFGLYYKRYVDKYGNTHHERWLYYCLFIISINTFNVLRSFSVYRIGDHFNQPLVQKLLFTIWSTECALKAIIIIKSCYRQNGLPYFFEKWNTICNNAPLDRVCLLMMKKYMAATFLFLMANSLVFILVLQYVPVLNDIYLEVVWRGALTFGHVAVFNIYLGVFAVILSTSSMLPVSLFVILSCAVGKQLSKFKEDLKLSVREDDFHGKFEELRVRHQNLSLLIDILDRIFAPMIAACYCANIPMFCLVLYTMVTSTNIHISLVLINFFWLCFILLQMAIVSTTAAWVHSQMAIVSTTAAWVHSQAHSPLEHIYTIRFSSTSNDTQLQMYMFLNRLTGTQIGFTAMRLFVVDRPTILTIAGMMMTYFVILVQFKLPVIQGDCLCNVTGIVHLENSSLEITQVV